MGPMVPRSPTEPMPLDDALKTFAFADSRHLDAIARREDPRMADQLLDPLQVALGGQADEAQGTVAKEALEVAEGVEPSAEGRVELVVVVALHQDPAASGQQTGQSQEGDPRGEAGGGGSWQGAHHTPY